MMVIEVNMLRRYYAFLVIVLNIYKLINQLPLMMIIGHYHRAADASTSAPLLSNQLLPDKVPDSFGTVGITLFTYMCIEFINKLFLQRNPEAVKVSHNILLSMPDGYSGIRQNNTNHYI